MKTAVSTKNNRYPVLDLLRGIAIIAMILFHLRHLILFVFDRALWFDFSPLFWAVTGKIGAILFIAIAGFSFIFSVESGKNIYKVGLKRFTQIGSLALIISLFTYYFSPEQRIVFGILHFFSVAFLLLPFFIKLKYWNILVAIAIIILGNYLLSLHATTPYLFPLGYHREDFYSADYYPLLPWFGILLLGYIFGMLFSQSVLMKKLFSVSLPGLGWISFLGRHSLLIYVIHVPILFVFIWIILKIAP